MRRHACTAAVSALCALLVTACGGGGGGASSSPPEPTVVSVSAVLSDNANETLAVGDDFRLQLQAQWTATGQAPAQVYLQVRDTKDSFELPAIRSVSGSWSVDLPLRSALPAGVRDGQLEVRACRDSVCADPFAGTAAALPYRLTLAAVENWTTHQGGNSHRGYLPIRLEPTKFRQVWTWQRPRSSEPIGGINAVVTMSGMVFVTTDIYFGEAVLHALDEADGKTVWMRSLGQMPAFGPPAVSTDRVFAATAGHQDSFLWSFDLRTGAITSKSGFDGQWPHVLNPTLVDGTAVVGAGYYGGTLYGYSMLNGDRLWTRSVGGAWDMFSVAADEQKLYHHTGRELVVLDRASGNELTRIADLLGRNADHSYHGGPILGNGGVVVAYSGGAFSGRASSSTEHYDLRVLSAFDTVQQKALWNSASSYRSTPALADGVLYVGNDTALDAIDLSTGTLLWRFTPDPVADGNRFHRNVVATRSHLFVSTDARVLALDLKSRTVVWRYSKPGMLAISADRTLYINVGARESSGELVAVRLQ